MANLKEIRQHISSIKSMQQITSAMKMVSAAKLRKAQDAIIQMRPYAEMLNEILIHVNANLEGNVSNKYSEHKEVKKVLLIAVASNRGLCGSFNSNVIKKTIELIQSRYYYYHKMNAIDIIAIGKKAEDGFKARNLKVIGNYSSIYDHLNFKEVSEIAQKVMDVYANREYDRVELIYNQFKNAAVQELKVEQFLPVVNSQPEQLSPKGKKARFDYIFEPSLESVVDIVIPKSLKIHFYRTLLDSVASEHGARMTAMHKATDNAAELVRDLNLEYNKARQTSITNEILEIVSGANALKG